jgi:hypothetical protein
VAGLLVVTGAFFGFIALSSNPASAHQPVILDENDNSPERGPELVDGTVSFAVYGSITRPGELRGLSFNLKAGDRLVVDLLIPNLEPELSSPLPSITVLDPDGNPTDPPVELGETFNESFSGTSYRYLVKMRSSATKAGKYGVVVGNVATGRFVIGIGDREVRGEVKQDDAIGSLASWYSSPGASPAPAKGRSSSGRVWFVAIPIVALVSLFLVARRRSRSAEQSKASVRQ